MRTYNDEGIIIKIKTLKEADRLVVFLTKRNGIVESVAKGGAKSSSRKVSSLDLLNNVKINLYETNGLDILREVQVIEDYLILKQDKKTINQLLYLLEVVDRLIMITGQELESFLLLKSLLHYSTLYPHLIDLFISSFELKILRLAGFEPNLTIYTNTLKPMMPNEKRIIAYGEELGYAYSITDEGDLLIGDKLIKVQRFLIDNDFPKIASLEVDNDLLTGIKSIQRDWIEKIIEKRLKSRSLLNN